MNFFRFKTSLLCLFSIRTLENLRKHKRDKELVNPDFHFPKTAMKTDILENSLENSSVIQHGLWSQAPPLSTGFPLQEQLITRGAHNMLTRVNTRNS